jgi:hypothetical protein
MEFRGESAVALMGSRRLVYENSNIHMVRAFLTEGIRTPSVRLFVTHGHRLNRLSDFHEIRHKSFSKKLSSKREFRENRLSDRRERISVHTVHAS